MNELIRVVQLPVIEERLRAMKEQVDARVNEALSLACTDETLTAVKAARADLRKDFDTLETERKAVKAAVLGPYEAFEKIYRECVSDTYKQADAELKKKIDAIEDGIKSACEAELKAYFAELTAAEHVEWLTWDRLGLKIDLTSARQKSHTKLRDRVAEFVCGVAQSVETISNMEDAEEIMAEFRQCLSIGQAIGIVQERHQRIEAERRAAEARKAAMEAQRSAVEKVEAAAPPVVAAPPVAAPAEEQACDPGEILRCTFTVLATREQLKRLKAFLNQEGIRYE